MKNTLVVIAGLMFFMSAFAETESMPQCFDTRNQLSVMNEKVVQLKSTLQNLEKAQVFVKVKFVKMLFATKNSYGSHLHFIVSLRDSVKDSEGLIEISHSLNSYNAPSEADLKAGPIYICGEYSTTRADGYPKITKFKPSETGAMIHWTHQANQNNFGPVQNGHSHGWIYANGKLFGKFAIDATVH